MLDYDTNNRLQEARAYANRLAADMPPSRPRSTDEAAHPGSARLGLALAGRVGLLRRRGHVPAYQA
jgi:hypothetical protein